MIYLNVGHTGLDSPSLPRWIARHRTRAVYLIHDLIPLTHPQFCREGESTRHARRITHALESASGIIANSQETLRELARFSGGRGLALPPGIAAWINGYTGPKDVAPISLPQPYFVAVGTIEARKNHLTLLAAWDELVAELGSAAPILVIIGNRGWEAEEVISRLSDLGSLAGNVREIPSCADEELARWIAGARALLMPSFAEGFGLPIIEALQLGTPVIASDLPVYREVVGDLPTYLDATDNCAWAEAVKRFTREGSERQRQLAEIEQYRAPTWEDHFQKTEEWLDGL
jgi:glycosyltransferase involved in cell wall biosynthesis